MPSHGDPVVVEARTALMSWLKRHPEIQNYPAHVAQLGIHCWLRGYMIRATGDKPAAPEVPKEPETICPKCGHMAVLRGTCLICDEAVADHVPTERDE